MAGTGRGGAKWEFAAETLGGRGRGAEGKGGFGRWEDRGFVGETVRDLVLGLHAKT